MRTSNLIDHSKETCAVLLTHERVGFSLGAPSGALAARFVKVLTRKPTLDGTRGTLAALGDQRAGIRSSSLDGWAATPQNRGIAERTQPRVQHRAYAVDVPIAS
jgi:hypothetical protein